MKKLVVLASLFICFSGSCKVNSSELMELEETVRKLTGKVETLEHVVAELRKEIERIKEDRAQAAAQEQNSVVLNLVNQKQPEEIIKIAEDLIEENRSSDARKLLQTFIDNNPGSIYIGKMKFFIGRSYFAEKNYKQAASEFLDSYTINSKGAKAPDALYMLALSFTELSKKDQARETLKKIISDYPASDAAKKAKRKLGNLQKRSSSKR